jgi:hypothetical protein
MTMPESVYGPPAVAGAGAGGAPAEVGDRTLPSHADNSAARLNTAGINMRSFLCVMATFTPVLEARKAART